MEPPVDLPPFAVDFVGVFLPEVFGAAFFVFGLDAVVFTLLFAVEVFAVPVFFPVALPDNGDESFPEIVAAAAIVAPAAAPVAAPVKTLPTTSLVFSYIVPRVPFLRVVPDFLAVFALAILFSPPQFDL